ncbi:hypothetical protein IWX90DRAFT_215677 [Phyllosticta citrichinensis]|uniref:G-patch domain-containing protein n=1 Tax=Phyllosticta citrichinensis TaxID=1130410 RepID=A0ABR1XTE5_9PEZI
MSASDDDDYYLPLTSARFFGDGPRAKRVKFVPASSATPQTSSTSSKPDGPSAADLYLSIIGSKKPQTAPATPSELSNPRSEEEADTSRHDRSASAPTQPAASTTAAGTTSTPPPPAIAEPETCPSCKLPLVPGHEATLAHQISLQHSHPPSAIERSRKGLAYLRKHGWDPDSRQGLGAGGEGVLYPIKAKEKNDKLGVGMTTAQAQARTREKEKKEKKLDAAGVRKKDEEDKKRRERLQRMFYERDDVLKYLGEG